MVRIFVVVAVVVGCVGCGAPAPELALSSTLELPLGTPCPTDASGSEFSSDELRVTIAGSDMKTVATNGSVGSLTIKEVPAGIKRVVGVFGLNAGRSVWRGVARDVVIKEGADTTINVLMSKIADFTCARNVDTPRSFHTATVLKDGRVLLLGGAQSAAADSANCAGGGCTLYTASAAASLYDPTTGTLTATGPMSVPRMMHVAVLLPDGRVVVAGGARSLQARPVDASFRFPLVPPAGAVLGSIEVYDPATGTFTPAGDEGGPRLFAAGSPTLSGEAIITGGIPGAGASPYDLSNAVATTTLCGGKPLACRPGPPMARARAGHIAFAIDPEGVFLMGGAINVTADSNGDGVDDGPAGYHVERWEGDAAFTLRQFRHMTPDLNVFFPTWTQYQTIRVLVGGGLRRAAGAFTVAAVLADAVQAAPAFVFDITLDEQGDVATGSKLHLQHPSFLGAAAVLSGNTRALVMGGFADLALTPTATVDLYDEATLSIRLIPVGGSARALRQPRGAATASGLEDGTVVVSGGNSTAGPASTVEIFADPKTPPGVEQ